MKLYDFALAPNPRRVRMFLAEKGIEVPMVQINTREKEQFAESFGAVLDPKWLDLDEDRRRRHEANRLDAVAVFDTAGVGGERDLELVELRDAASGRHAEAHSRRG